MAVQAIDKKFPNARGGNCLIYCLHSIDQNIFPELLGKTKVFYFIEHFGLSKYRGKNCLIYCLHSH